MRMHSIPIRAMMMRVFLGVLLLLSFAPTTCHGELKVIKRRMMMMRNKKVETLDLPIPQHDVSHDDETLRENPNSTPPPPSTTTNTTWQEKVAEILSRDYDMKQLGFYAGTAVLALVILLVIVGSTMSSSASSRQNDKTTGKKHKLISSRGNRPKAPLDVVVVGCGLPKKGMGWFHLTQLLDMPLVNVVAVVEPFFMNPKLCSEVPPSFTTLQQTLQAQGVAVVKSVDDLEDFASHHHHHHKPTLCLIAGRTADNSTLFRQCVAHHASVIYLEKPGAPSVQELQDMHDMAHQHNIPVYLGYNKNVTSYIQKAVTLARQTPHSKLVLAHNNSYTREDLPEVFSRNAEGMLHNMAIHELALLVTYLDITVDTVRSLTVNTSKLFSEKLQVPYSSASANTIKTEDNGKTAEKATTITDFSRVAFKITDVNGEMVSIFADRCGGNVSFAMVQDEQGRELAKFEFPDPEQMIVLEEKIRADPDMMPYFFVQGPDYLELKRRVIDATLQKRVADGVATLQVGIQALKLAAYANTHLEKALAVTIGLGK